MGLLKQEPGSWMGEWGECKVCGGEIPHGHIPECDIFKMDQQIQAAEEALADVARLTHELDVALNGEAGAAKQASLCDIVSQLKQAKATGRLYLDPMSEEFAKAMASALREAVKEVMRCP